MSDIGDETRLVPVTVDHDTGGFFQAAAEGRLVVRACSQCGRVLHLPMPYCHACGSWEGEWRELVGTARLYSWTTVEHQVHPAYPVPYTIVLVEPTDAPEARFVGHLPGTHDLVDGQLMEVWFEDVDGTILPQWRPADAGPTRDPTRGAASSGRGS